MAGGVFLEAEHHPFEHLEGFALVGNEWILLRVAAETDALLEMVHGKEVILPKAVEDGEHDDTLVVAHLLGAEDLLFDVVAGAKLFEDGFAELVAIELGGVDLFFEVGAEEVVELGEERLELPLVGDPGVECRNDGTNSHKLIFSLDRNVTVAGSATATQGSATVGELVGGADAELDRVDFRQALRPALADLAPRERTIVLLRFFGNMTQTQIAQEVGISQMHVSRLLTQTLDRLRSRLDPETRVG